MTEESAAALLTYRTKKENFDSVYERNKFYRGLFGYTQTVKRKGKRDEDEKEGLMEERAKSRRDESVWSGEEESEEEVVA